MQRIRLVVSGEPFSALQRAEIAEIQIAYRDLDTFLRAFSALQRAEIAEMMSR